LVERTTENREVTGSTPVGATKTRDHRSLGFFNFTGFSPTNYRLH
jgi:hypothetical protein